MYNGFLQLLVQETTVQEAGEEEAPTLAPVLGPKVMGGHAQVTRAGAILSDRATLTMQFAPSEKTMRQCTLRLIVDMVYVYRNPVPPVSSK